VLVDRLPVVAVCGIAGVAYLGTARALGVWEGFGRPKGLPPFLDADTRAALETLAKAPVVAIGDVLVSPSGSWRMVAKDGALALVADPTPPRPGTAPTPLAIVVKVGRSPSLRGLAVGPRTWFAEGDTVVEGPVEGPRIPV
jgi:hypothetical protein